MTVRVCFWREMSLNYSVREGGLLRFFSWWNNHHFWWTETYEVVFTPDSQLPWCASGERWMHRFIFQMVQFANLKRTVNYKRIHRKCRSVIGWTVRRVKRPIPRNFFQYNGASADFFFSHVCLDLASISAECSGQQISTAWITPVS